MCVTATMHETVTNSASQIVGVDIVGGQPEYVRVRIVSTTADRNTDFIDRGGPNLTWRTPDYGPNSAFDFEAQDWPFAGNSFDLIHAGYLCGSISSWPKFLEKVKKYGAGQPMSEHNRN
jgi:hypothetical protein